MRNLSNDEIIITQYYKLQIEAILRKKPNLNPVNCKCELCDEVFLSGFIDYHYNTKEHQLLLEKKEEMYKNEYKNYLSVTQNGEPILLVYFILY